MLVSKCTHLPIESEREDDDDDDIAGSLLLDDEEVEGENADR